MNMLRRRLLCAVLPFVSMLAGCAATAPRPDAATLAALAPTGALRVGVYPGSPGTVGY